MSEQEIKALLKEIRSIENLAFSDNDLIDELGHEDLKELTKVLR